MRTTAELSLRLERLEMAVHKACEVAGISIHGFTSLELVGLLGEKALGLTDGLCAARADNRDLLTAYDGLLERAVAAGLDEGADEPLAEFDRADPFPLSPRARAALANAEREAFKLPARLSRSVERRLAIQKAPRDTTSA